MDRKSYIYEIYNTLNGKAYIGKTLNFEARMRSHICETIGEEAPSSEFQAYTIQNITLELLHAYNTTRRKILQHDD